MDGDGDVVGYEVGRRDGETVGCAVGERVGEVVKCDVEKVAISVVPMSCSRVHRYSSQLEQ